MLKLPEALAALSAYPQFVLWKLVQKPGEPKPSKIPHSPHTLQAFPKDSGWQTNPSEWATIDHAIQAAQVSGLNVGFIFTENDPFFFVDIDGALQSDGTWSPLAQEMCYAFQGCAVEISSSGTGLHIFGVGSAPEGHRNVDHNIGLEFYTKRRFVALTGTSCIGDAAYTGQAGVNFLLQKYLPNDGRGKSFEWTTEPDPEWCGPDDDDELIAKMLSAKQSASAAFGTKAPLVSLWAGDADVLAKFYPSPKDDVFNRSDADAALCSHLAFWAGKDCERMERLFNRSGLVRDKWENREDYRQDTITSACAKCTSVYQSKKKPKEVAEYQPPESIPVGQIREGYQFLGPSQQIEHFKDCVYVAHQHAIKVPNGSLVKPDTFRVMYGGYWFAMDSIGDKNTKSAWECFTESQALRFPRVDVTCFRPELGENTIVLEEGLTKVNVWVPVNVPKRKGDPGPFLRHLEKLIPNAHDRELLLSYMAACVQYVGVKFRWCPFIQGVPGNGKTTLSEIVAMSVGLRYSHSPAANDIANKFNDWVENKLFIYVSDIYTADRREVLEILKPLITDRRVEVQPKGGAKYMTDNRANFILNSNHKEGVPKSADDRRYAPFYTAQQTREDMQRDGMNGPYFQRLNRWLAEEGYEIMADFLATYPIQAAYDPTLMSEAPITSNTIEAINAGMGSLEQDIMEHINMGRPGFAGGWVSSIALANLIDLKRFSKLVPPNKRKEVMASLGYTPHPALKEGRMTKMSAIDGGGRPVLYIKRDHICTQLTTADKILDAYVKAQEVGGVELAQELFKPMNV